ncbi:13E12 repeat family protein [Microbacterium sp. EYE_512]|uniref:DUF222 domain-containing protein n=1 Tax=Microbacterium wangchenii TaxID=2541726 RepID=A0ABX5SRR7_9MICO|nr:13E12 repeat family protein [Microbacterium sp. EYE_512]QBR88502.1 DUF222 domain-containing protein [Microbacterium wangchenii]TXK20229.1 DUF222 domain-containing protein [Microbacterium wangchenii]
MENSFGPGELSTGDAARMRAGLTGAREQEAIIARAQAARIRHHAALVEVTLEQTARMTSRDSREREMPMRSLAAEIAFATHVHDLTAQKELNDAYTLVSKLPATVVALQEARISQRHVTVMLDVGVGIDDDDVREAWEQTVLDFAVKETPGRTKAYARELAEAVNPVGMDERHARAAETRGVSILDLDDGMALLQLRLPAALAYGIRDRIRRHARVIRDEANAERARRGDDPASAPDAGAEPAVDDARTLAQIGADVPLTCCPPAPPRSTPPPATGTPAGWARSRRTCRWSCRSSRSWVPSAPVRACTDRSRSTPTPPGCSPPTLPGGIGCWFIRSPARSSRSTGTRPARIKNGSCRRATSTAGASDAASPRTAARSTTIPSTTTAAARPSATSPTCASAITP